MPPGGLIFGGAIERRDFALRVIWRGLYMERLIFGVLRYLLSLSHSQQM